MRNLIRVSLCYQFLMSFSNIFAEDSIEVVKKNLGRVVSYESHPFRNDIQIDSRTSHVFFRDKKDVVQEDHSPSSLSDLANITSLSGPVDQEDTLLEFIKPLESEPKNSMGGISMGAPTIFSRFSHAQLQSVAALKLLKKYEDNRQNKKDFEIPEIINMLYEIRN